MEIASVCCSTSSDADGHILKVRLAMRCQSVESTGTQIPIDFIRAPNLELILPVESQSKWGSL